MEAHTGGKDPFSLLEIFPGVRERLKTCPLGESSGRWNLEVRERDGTFSTP